MTGNSHDAPAGRLLLETLELRDTSVDLLMDRAYEDDLTRLASQVHTRCAAEAQP